MDEKALVAKVAIALLVLACVFGYAAGKKLTDGGWPSHALDIVFGPFRKLQSVEGDEWLSPCRHETLEHGGTVHIVNEAMGIDMKTKSVEAYLLRGIYHELRQLNITLDRMKFGNSG